MGETEKVSVPFSDSLKVPAPFESPYGLNRRQTFFVTIISVIGSFKVFELVYMMTGGGPADATIVLLLRMYQVGFSFLKLGEAAAISWVLFVLIMIATLIQFRASKWVHYA